MQDKIIGFGKVVMRNKPVRRVGVDTNLVYAWIKNEEYLGNHKPKFCHPQEDKLFINYKVFGELMGLLAEENDSLEDVRSLIFDFLRRNNISLLKKKWMDQKRFEETLGKLKQKFTNRIKESDLRIIAIFYCFNIDCILSSDEKHFAEPCNFLGINYEKHFEIEVGSEADVREMLKNLYPRKYGKRK